MSRLVLILLILSSPAHADRVRIPVFADVHGRIETLFRAVSRLQARTGDTFERALIAGDLGWFPYPGDLPEVIRRKEIKTATDHGYANYHREEFAFPPSGKRTLRQRYFEDAREPHALTLRFYFVRGNHEDHELLKDRELSGDAVIPVDPRGVFNYLADGAIFEVSAPDGQTLRIGAFGGIHPESRPGRTRDNPLMIFDRAALDRLIEASPPGTLDVLLTHQGPAATHGGHPEIDALVEVLSPRVHLHGHAGAANPTTLIGQTPSTCVPELTDATALVTTIEWTPSTGAVIVLNL